LGSFRHATGNDRPTRPSNAKVVGFCIVGDGQEPSSFVPRSDNVCTTK
jgi:hypothetical protein